MLNYDSPMKVYYVLRALGKDRVGIVDDLSTMILESDCNIEESRMAVLGGEFAVIMLVSSEQNNMDTLIAQLEEAESRLSMSIEMKETESPHGSPSGLPYLIESLSLDAPGIVRTVTARLKKLQVNIGDLETDSFPAPWTGAPMFRMKIRVTIPQELSIHTFREELDSFEVEEGLDITIEAIR